jgi:hypothetical protein
MENTDTAPAADLMNPLYTASQTEEATENATHHNLVYQIFKIFF